MIRGIPIKVYAKEQTGVDGFNHPVYQRVEKTIENVLVEPASAVDIENELNLSGKKISYTLYIPKGDKTDWHDVDVEFKGRKYHTVADSVEWLDDLVPLSWNRKVSVYGY